MIFRVRDYFFGFGPKLVGLFTTLQSLNKTLEKLFTAVCSELPANLDNLARINRHNSVENADVMHDAVRL